jgi:hypothetical protein
MADRPSFASSATARQQHGILRLDQLSGMTRSKVRTEIRSGRWQSLGYGVVAVHNGPLTQQQQSFAVLLRCPPGSALSGPTAAACDGLDLGRIGVDGEAVHVTLPCGNRRPRDLRAVVHWSEFLDDRDVHPTREPRRTRIARSIVDAASWQRTDRMARAVVLAGVQQRLVTPDRLDDALSRRGQCGHHGLILESDHRRARRHRICSRARVQRDHSRLRVAGAQSAGHLPATRRAVLPRLTLGEVQPRLRGRRCAALRGWAA